MAAPGKQAMRWGSFLSQAVAGVESRLDNMLGDEAQGTAAAPDSGTKTTTTINTQPAPAAPARSNSVNARTTAGNRANDRLQARLAKAMAAKGGQSGNASPRSSVDQSNRPSMEKPSMERPSMEKPSMEKPSMERPSMERPSMEQPPTDKELVEKPSQDSKETPSVNGEPDKSNDDKDTNAIDDVPPQPDASNTSTTSVTTSTPAEASNDTDLEKDNATDASQVKEDLPVEETQQDATETDQPQDPQPEPPSEAAPASANDTSSTSASTKALEEVVARQQEEIQEYVERIDSLQAKLQYLSKNASESAKKAASSAPAGSHERKLAEKDQRIALLMEEGQKLSTTEQKFRTMLRKLRQQIVDNEKQAEELKKARDKANLEVEVLRSRLDGSEDSEKIQEEARRATAGLRKEIDALKKQLTEKDDSLRRLEQEHKSKSEQSESTHADALKAAVAAEKEKQKELEDSVAALRIEKDSISDKLRQEVIEWREKYERAVERARTVETDLKHELRSMESKLEAMRTAAEEASSGTGGEAQVKLLRQIETLQSQYATASDNWQGIEASLLAKVSDLEKEKDEAQRRESEMRKKARDAASRCRHLEGELQDLQPALATAQQELEATREQLASLRTSSKSTEAALEQARAELEKRQQSTSREDAAEAERRQWVEDVTRATARSQSQSRPASPFFPPPRTYSSELNSLPVPGRSRRAPTPGSIPDTSDHLSLGRRLSSQPPIARSILSPAAIGQPPSPFLPFEHPNETQSPPPIGEREDEQYDSGLASPRHVANDMISVSTVAAGPSVQLVERMSAAIRRLEAEKVAAREEMARVCSQRDEARADMVGLMKDLEAAKSAPSRVKELEEEVTSLNARYQTTLEMLGEKSELVEELKADVQDVKAMYRELVERTIK